MLSRRLCTLAAAAALILSVGTIAESRPRAAGPLAVDVSRLRDLGLGSSADLVQTTVASQLAADGMGGRVAVRVTGLSMVSYAGGDAAGGGSGGNGSSGGYNDYLEGDVLLLGPGGQVVGQRHQVVASPASSGGAWYLPGAELRRIEAVSRIFADWARRTAL